MTQKTIILPIKCSTVKKLNTCLKDLIGIELIIFSITFLLTIGGFQISVLFTDHAKQLYLSIIVVVIGWSILLFCVQWCMLVIATYLQNRIPKLECIKDEEIP